MYSKYFQGRYLTLGMAPPVIRIGTVQNMHVFNTTILFWDITKANRCFPFRSLRWPEKLLSRIKNRIWFKEPVFGFWEMWTLPFDAFSIRFLILMLTEPSICLNSFFFYRKGQGAYTCYSWEFCTFSEYMISEPPKKLMKTTSISQRLLKWNKLGWPC